MIEQLPAIIVVVPLVTAFAIFAAGWWSERPAYPMTLVGMSVCLVSSLFMAQSVLKNGVILYRLGGWPPPWGIVYRIDHLNAFMLVLVSFLGLATVLYAGKIVARELPRRVSLFWSLYSLLMTGLLGIIATGDLFNLFVLLEVASLTGYTLVAIGQGKALVASFRYLVIGTIGASFYLLGVGYLYITTGSLNMADLQSLLPALYTSRAVLVAFVFIFVGFGIKIALFPLHSWQPDAYTYAPSAVSIIISTAAAKTFAYALIRICFSVFTIDFINHILPIFKAITWIAAVAMMTGSIFAISQYNLKRMLAYSSIANVGYIVMAMGLAPNTSLGLTPAVMHLANHAVIKGCMFMAACGFIYKYGLEDIRQFTGLGRRMPYTSLALILAALAMIGMPPGAGFVTKWYLIRAALEAHGYAFVAAIFISTLLMIVYFWRVIEIMYIRTDDAGASGAPVALDELPPAMRWTTLTMAGLTFLLGIVWMTGVLDPFTAAINAGFGLGGTP
jgi:multicomponent Na+:H+ antiporter subunit D